MKPEIKLLESKIESLEFINNSRYIEKQKIVDSLNQILKTNCPELWKKAFLEKYNVFEKLELLKFEIGFKTKCGIPLKLGTYYKIHRFGFDGNETEFECRCKIIYSKQRAAYCVKLIDDRLGYEFSENEDWILPICLIEGLHEDSFSILD